MRISAPPASWPSRNWRCKWAGGATGEIYVYVDNVKSAPARGKTVEIRQQGIPATLVCVNHFDALKAAQGVSTVADLAKSKGLDDGFLRGLGARDGRHWDRRCEGQDETCSWHFSDL